MADETNTVTTPVSTAAADLSAGIGSPTQQFQSTTGGAQGTGNDAGSGQGSATGAAAGGAGVSDAQAVQDVYEMVVDGNSNKVPKAVIDQAAAALGLDPRELLKGGQLSKAGYERLKAANEQTKRLEQFATLLQQNGPEALERLAAAQGIDPAEFQKSIEEWLVKRYTASVQTPEQRRLAELEAREQQIQAYEQKMRQEAEEKRIQQQVENDRPRLENEVKEAFKQVDFPHTPTFMRKTAETMLHYLDEGVRLNFTDAANLVKQEMKSYVTTVRKELKTIDDVRRVFGDEMITQIRKMDVESLRSTPPARKADPDAPRTQRQTSTRTVKSLAEAEAEANRQLEQYFGQRR